MKRKAYMLIFDREDSLDQKSIHERIVNSPSIISWWHYIKSSYIIIATTNNATVLQKEILEAMPNKRFLVIEVNLKNRNGWLPNDAWEWIKNQSQNII